MDKILGFINKNLTSAVFAPFVISSVSFFANLALAMRDGVIDENEFHALFTSANGVETLILGLIMYAVKAKK